MDINFKFLGRGHPLSLYFFAVPRLCLGLMGYWPETLKQWGLVNFVVLAVGVLTELHAGFAYLQNKQLTLALETLCPAATSAVTLLKICLMLYYREDLVYILKRLRQLLFNSDTVSINMENAQIMRRQFMLAGRLNFWALSAAFLTCTIYISKPLLLALFLSSQADNEWTWSTPFNMTMPKWLLRAPFFPLTYIFISYTGYVTIFMFGGCDGFYFEFCSHIAALLQMLQTDLQDIFQPYEDRLQLTFMECARIEDRLLLLIKRHNAIIDLVSFFRQRYAVITLAHFLSASIVIAISIFDLIALGDNGLGTLLYIAYTVAALSQLLIYCFGGNLIADSSAKIATVVSSCPWNLCQAKQRRYLLLLMLRSQRALSMAVPFFSPSLATFAAILQTSGSFIALAKSFQ